MTKVTQALGPDVRDEAAAAGREALAAETRMADSEHREPHDTLSPV